MRLANARDSASRTPTATAAFLLATVRSAAVGKEFGKVTRTYDRLISIGDLFRDGRCNFIDWSEEVHHERSAIEELVDIQQHRRRTRLRQRLSACFHGVAFVAFQSPNQQLVFVSGWPQDTSLGDSER